MRIEESGRPPFIVTIPRSAELIKQTLPVFAQEPVVLEEMVYETPMVGDTLRFLVAAVEGDDSSWIGGAVAAFGMVTGGVGAVIVGSALEGSLGPSVTVIATFDAIWDRSSNWGRGRYFHVGAEDLMLTFAVVVDGRTQ